MNWRAVARPLGYLLTLIAVAMALPLPIAIAERGGAYPTWQAFGCSAALTGLLGWMLTILGRHRVSVQPRRREALLIVACCWLAGSVFCALPFLLSHTYPGFWDAWFEASSGITTTGASVLGDVEALPRSILFWRALITWLGGLGFVVFVAALLPALGVGAKFLLSYEATSAKEGSLQPRVTSTSRWLIVIYCALTVLCFFLFWRGGMTAFDALCHAFATLATGGMSTHNNSYLGYGTYLHLVTALMMFAASVDFSLYYRVLRRDFRLWRDPQLRLYTLVVVGGTLLVFVQLLAWGAPDPLIALRDSVFNCVAISSSTGFSSADFEHWPPGALGVMLVMMAMGGCAGSTAGGLKMLRVIIVLRWLGRFVRRSFSPNQVVAVRIGGLAVDAETEDELSGYVLLFIGWWLIGALLVMATGADMLTAVTGALACISNAGVALGQLGPLDNYGAQHPFAKAVFSLLMLGGRLELLAFSALLTPGFWRR